MKIENKKTFILGLLILFLAVGSVIIRFFVFNEFSIKALIKGVIGLFVGIVFLVTAIKLDDENEVE